MSTQSTTHSTAPLDHHETLHDITEALGIDLPHDLLILALTHRSYAYEHGGLPTNERLEFLGDAVLGLVITEELYRRYPDRPEGDLAKLRANLVNTVALADIARSITSHGLGAYLFLGRGETASGGANKSSILADGMESLLGALYLSHGLDQTKTVILRLFDTLINTVATRGAGLDWKTSLQELAASHSLGSPSYQVHQQGPDHSPQFSAIATVDGKHYGTGIGKTKKEAEQHAAACAWKELTHYYSTTSDHSPH